MRNLSEHILPSLSAQETCERCGAAFSCGASASACWCAEVKLSEATRAELRGLYERCLCRACLESFAGLEAKASGEING